MKILISDYSSEHTTEPLYLNTIFNSIGCTSVLCPPNMSMFDTFDITQPNLFITHFSKISKDVVAYLKECKDIDIIVNVTNLKQDSLNQLESTLYENGIKPLFFFVNNYDHQLKASKTNINVVLHGADVLFGNINKMFDIDCGIFVDKSENLRPIGETYHYLSNYQKMEDIADIVMPNHKLTQFYPSYNRIIFKYFNNTLPQAFFDAAYYGRTVYYDIDDRSILDVHLQKLFGESGLCVDQDTGCVSQRIKQKHTCLHRAKSLLSQLPCKVYTDKLQAIIEEQLK